MTRRHVISLTILLSPVYSQEHFNDTLSNLRSKRSARQHHHHNYDLWYDPYYQHEKPLLDAGRLLTLRENQMLLRNETKNRTSVDCCPSVLEMVEPKGGTNQEDKYVELYRDGVTRQRFYELSCHRDIVDKPCRFMDRKLHNQSRCVQKYSYTYALVKDTGRHHHQRPNHLPSFPSSGPGGALLSLDYIRVRSGCSCEVTPITKRKRDKKLKKRGKHEDTGQ